MYSNNTVNLLKSLYNGFILNVATWQTNAATALLAGNQMENNIALAKMQSYQDCANSVLNILQQG